MDYQQLQELCRECHRLGITTMGELAKFKAAHGCRTNEELLKALREATRV